MIVGIEIARELNSSLTLANACRTGKIDKLLDLSEKSLEDSLIPWTRGSEATWLEAVRSINTLEKFPEKYQGNESIQVLSTWENVPHNYTYNLRDDIEIVNAARQSTKKGIGEDKVITDELNEVRSLKFMFRHAHTSPFEQVEYQFELELPKAIASQLIRHRTAKVNELSLRFTELNKTDSVARMTPFDWRQQHQVKLQCSNGAVPPATALQATEIYEEAMKASLDAYKRLIEIGVCREQARYVLPCSFMTSLKWKMDLHNLAQLLYKRIDTHAQREIQEMAWAMALNIRAKNPLTYLFIMQKLAINKTWEIARDTNNTELIHRLCEYI